MTKVVDMLQSQGKEAEEAMGEGSGVKWAGLGGSDGDTIILDTTAEFCKQVGEEEKGNECVCVFCFLITGFLTPHSC